MSKNIKNKTIHILGGGPAGISATYYAHKNQYDYHLYEASNQVGGNAKTLNFDNFLIGDYFDGFLFIRDNLLEDSCLLYTSDAADE